MAYFIVRGQNVDDVLKQRETDLIAKFQTGEFAGSFSTPSGLQSGPAPRAVTGLTDEQRAVANAMGLTEEGYASQIKLAKPPGGY